MRTRFCAAAIAAGLLGAVALPAVDALAADAVPPVPSSSVTESEAAKGTAPVERRPTDTQKLVDGYVANIFKLVSRGETPGEEKGYEAEIRTAFRGPVLTLRAPGASAVGRHGWHTFTLTADGNVTATRDGDDQPQGVQPSAVQRIEQRSTGGQGATGHDGDGKPNSSDALATAPDGGVKAGAQSVESMESVESRAGMVAGGVGLIGAGAAGIILVLRRRNRA